MVEPDMQPTRTAVTARDHEILLVTLNARYSHTAFGLRYLQANLGDLRPRSALLELTISDAPLAIVEQILAHHATIVGFGVYIWNTTQTLAVLRLLRALRPQLVIVLGGPEISHEWTEQPHFALADHIVTGEAEDAFRDLCARRLAGEVPPKVIRGGLPDTSSMVLPYDLYTDHDLAHRVIYVEASRGCPFRCEFCLSALDKKVRSFDLPTFLDALARLVERGARSFKFVDRTFNLSPKTSRQILEFFLSREEEIFVHFEMVPDRFPAALRSLIARFPPGAVQLEVGIQTLDHEVARRIDRHQDNDKIFDNLAFLVRETGVHLHTDLIVGLPGESLTSFGRGFDRLLETGVQEIQVGILKRLRGAVITRHTASFEMVYSPLPPYEILQNRDWTMVDLARMRRFARYWDIIANSGRFGTTLPVLLAAPSPFERFLDWSDWVYAEVGRTHGLSFRRSLDLLFAYLTQRAGVSPEQAAAALYADHRRLTGKTHVPEPLRGHVRRQKNDTQAKRSVLPARQERHQRLTP